MYEMRRMSDMNIFIDTISAALFITFSPPSYRRFNVANNFQWIKIFMNCALYFDIQFILNRQLKVRLKYHIHLHKSWKDRISNFWKSYYLNNRKSRLNSMSLESIGFLVFFPTSRMKQTGHSANKSQFLGNGYFSNYVWMK